MNCSLAVTNNGEEDADLYGKNIFAATESLGNFKTNCPNPLMMIDNCSFSVTTNGEEDADLYERKVLHQYNPLTVKMMMDELVSHINNNWER
jgi:hypothetical protein